MTTADSLRPVRRRPRDRRQQIIAHATELFAARGFPQVSMSTIAEANGITAGALYRHFTNKSDLLQAVFDSAFGFTTETLPGTASGEGWDEFMMYGAGFAEQHPAVGTLWFREIRYLPDEDRKSIRAQVRTWAMSGLPLIKRLRPGMDQGQSELLMWALVSIIASPYSRFHSAPLEARAAGMRKAMQTILEVQLHPTGPVKSRKPRRVPVARGERLLQAAIEQFGRRGYAETSMVGVGTAADVSGANLYSYFDSKADLLKTVLDRGRHVAMFELTRVLAESESAEDALIRLIAMQQSLPAVWTRWVIEPEFDDQDLRPIRESHRDYTQEWISLLRENDPKLTEDTARVRVGITMTILSDLGQTASLARHSSFAPNVQALAQGVVFNRPVPKRIDPAHFTRLS